jgi:CRP-like cAMP-binding protein
MADLSATVSGAALSQASEPQPVDPLLRRLASISVLTPEQVRIVAAMQGPPQKLAPRSQLGRAGDPATSAYVIHEGWAFAYTLLANGERQVHGFLLPGNIVRLDDLFRDRAGRGVETITDTVVSEISMGSLRRVSRRWPEIFELLLRLQSQVQSALVEQLVDLGRRDSRARVAHLLLRLERRLMRIGRAGPDGYYCPISQYLIADALGLTAVHVNRVLKGLREDGVVTIRSNHVTIHDRVRLMEFAGFDQQERDASPNLVLMLSPPRSSSRIPL